MGLSDARKDILLNALSHDVVIVAGDFVWTTGGEGVRQAIKIAVLMIMGEVFYDQGEGVPWFEWPGVVTVDEAILGTRFVAGRVEGIVAGVILAVPDVGRLDSITASFERTTRTLSVSWVVTTAFGDTITDTAVLTR